MDADKQRIADLERELKFRDGRINELKTELDEQRELVRAMEEHIKQADEELESFCDTFGLVLDEDGKWTNSEAVKEEQRRADAHHDLVVRYNKLVRRFNANIARVNPIGRPLATSEGQQAQILKHHKAGRSSRWIAEEMTLSRRAVTTVIGKSGGTDRTTVAQRLRLGLEPKKKDRRAGARERLPKRINAHLEKGRKLIKEAKGLR
jgi:hypothetical protein